MGDLGGCLRHEGNLKFEVENVKRFFVIRLFSFLYKNIGHNHYFFLLRLLKKQKPLIKARMCTFVTKNGRFFTVLIGLSTYREMNKKKFIFWDFVADYPRFWSRLFTYFNKTRSKKEERRVMNIEVKNTGSTPKTCMDWSRLEQAD